MSAHQLHLKTLDPGAAGACGRLRIRLLASRPVCPKVDRWGVFKRSVAQIGT